MSVDRGPVQGLCVESDVLAAMDVHQVFMYRADGSFGCVRLRPVCGASIVCGACGGWSFHTYRYGFFRFGLLDGVFGRLSILLCMESMLKGAVFGRGMNLSIPVGMENRFWNPSRCLTGNFPYLWRWKVGIRAALPVRGQESMPVGMETFAAAGQSRRPNECPFLRVSNLLLLHRCARPRLVCGSPKSAFPL